MTEEAAAVFMKTKMKRPAGLAYVKVMTVLAGNFINEKTLSTGIFLGKKITNFTVLMSGAGGRGRSKMLADFFVGFRDVSNGEVVLFEDLVDLTRALIRSP